MKILFYSTILCLATASLLSVVSCKKDQTDTKQSATPPAEAKSDTEEPAMQAAIETIKKEKNLRITGVQDGRIHIQNKYTKLRLDLSPQDIEEKKHLTLAALGPEYLQDEILDKQAKPDWGKAPEWIPRYPDAEIQPGAMHAPLQDGSIWGNVTITHTDSETLVADFLKQQFKKQDIKLATEMKRKGTTYLVFQRMNEDDEKRRITCTLNQMGGKTRVSIQYSYGMP